MLYFAVYIYFHIFAADYMKKYERNYWKKA